MKERVRQRSLRRDHQISPLCTFTSPLIKSCGKLNRIRSRTLTSSKLDRKLLLQPLENWNESDFYCCLKRQQSATRSHKCRKLLSCKTELVMILFYFMSLFVRLALTPLDVFLFEWYFQSKKFNNHVDWYEGLKKIA